MISLIMWTKLKNGPIENVKQIKYLGITITKKNCSFQPTLKEYGNKIMKAIFALNSKINLILLPVKVAIQLLRQLWSQY